MIEVAAYPLGPSALRSLSAQAASSRWLTSATSVGTMAPAPDADVYQAGLVASLPDPIPDESERLFPLIEHPDYSDGHREVIPLCLLFSTHTTTRRGVD